MRATDWLRKEAETYLRRALRDRGEALYFGAPVPGAQVPALFDAQLRERGTALSPRATALTRFEAEMRLYWLGKGYSPEGDELVRLLVKRRGEAILDGEMVLWYRGLKMLEEDGSAEEISRYEKALRQRAAVSLRTGGGGALWASGLCLSELRRRENEK